MIRKCGTVIFFVIVLSGCSVPEDTQSKGGTGLPTATQALVNTLTPQSSATPTDNLLPLVQVPTPDPSIDFSLIPPDSDQLFILLNYAFELYYSARFELAGGWFKDSAYHESRSLFAAIGYDIERYYPEGLPAWSQYVLQSVPEWEELWVMGAEGAHAFISRGFQQYLRKNMPILENGLEISTPTFKANFYAVESQSSLEEAWLIQVEYFDYGVTSFYSLIKIDDGEWIMQTDVLPPEPSALSNYTITVNTDYDLNEDGKNDILTAIEYYIAGGISGHIFVYNWNGGLPAKFGTVRLPGVTPIYGETSKSTFELGDFNGDGWDEIRTTHPRFYPFGCHWETTTITNWIGKEQQEYKINAEIPDTPQCYLAQILLADSLEDRIPWLEKYIASGEYKAGSTDLKAWAQLQLAVAYAAQGNDDEAETILASIIREVGNGPFLQAIQEANKQAGPSPLSVCQALYQKAQEIGSEAGTFGSDIDGYLASELYPISWEPMPSKVCPYWDLFLSDLSHKLFSGDVDVAQSLSEQGVTLRIRNDLNIDSDEESEIIAVVYADRLILVILDAGPEGWRMYPIDFVWYDEDAQPDLQASVYDADSNGINDILVLLKQGVEQAKQFPEICLPNSEDYNLMIIYINGQHEYSFLNRYLSCYSEPPFDIQTEQGKQGFVESVTECDPCSTFDGIYRQPPPDWVSLEGFLEEPRSDADIFDFCRELLFRVADEQDRTSVRAEIHDLIGFLPSDEPAVGVLLPELIYYIGLSYELDGEEAKAVEAYLDLIQEYPESPWSWLAWSRLEPSPLE